jgi:hypothetical protein
MIEILKVLRQLKIDESFFECILCLGPLDSPISLPCEHIVCSKCLANFEKQTMSNIYPNFYCVKCPKEFNVNFDTYKNIILEKLIEEFKRNKITLENLRLINNREIEFSNEEQIEALLNNELAKTIKMEQNFHKSTVITESCDSLNFYQPSKNLIQSIITIDEETEEEESEKRSKNEAMSRVIAKIKADDITVAYLVEESERSTFLDKIRNFCWCFTAPRIEPNRSYAQSFWKAKNNRIFLSCTNDTRPTAHIIKRELEVLGYKVWLDNSEFYSVTIEEKEKAIVECDLFFICGNSSYLNSRNAKNELIYAWKLDKILVPLLVEKDLVLNNEWLGYFYNDKIHIDMFNYTFDKFITVITQLIKAYDVAI